MKAHKHTSHSSLGLRAGPEICRKRHILEGSDPKILASLRWWRYWSAHIWIGWEMRQSIRLAID